MAGKTEKKTKEGVIFSWNVQLHKIVHNSMWTHIDKYDASKFHDLVFSRGYSLYCTAHSLRQQKEAMARN